MSLEGSESDGRERGTGSEWDRSLHQGNLRAGSPIQTCPHPTVGEVTHSPWKDESSGPTFGPELSSKSFDSGSPYFSALRRCTSAITASETFFGQAA